MEAEARAILEVALAAPEEDSTDLAAFARSLFAPLAGVELELPPRELGRDPPSFGVDTAGGSGKVQDGAAAAIAKRGKAAGRR